MGLDGDFVNVSTAQVWVESINFGSLHCVDWFHQCAGVCMCARAHVGECVCVGVCVRARACVCVCVRERERERERETDRQTDRFMR